MTRESREVVGGQRLFVGIPLPEELRDGFVALQRALDRLRNVKWVERENLHLTLKFLGAVEAAAVPRLGEALARAATRASPTRLQPVELTAFPRRSSARVLVLRLTDPSAAILDLQAGIEEELAALGHPRDERAFAVHVTLGRARGGQVDACAALAAVRPPRKLWSVESFELIESRLGPKGPTYRALGSFALGASGRGPS